MYQPRGGNIREQVKKIKEEIFLEKEKLKSYYQINNNNLNIKKNMEL